MKCPGQDMQYWTDGAIFDIECPKCGESVEFYKDDTSRKCGHCDHRFVNPKMDFGCAAYCQFAEQCLGTLPEEFKGTQDNLFKDKVAIEMKRHYKADFKSISRAMKVARHAENIGKSEGGNLAVILCAAYLHETGLSVAESILENLAADDSMTEEVLQIIDQHEKNKTPSTTTSKIVHDAVFLYALQEQKAEKTTDDEFILPNNLFTPSAKNLLAELV